MTAESSIFTQHTRFVDRGVTDLELSNESIPVNLEEERKRDYLKHMSDVWPRDQSPIVKAEIIEGRFGVVGVTENNQLVLTSFQVGILRKYEEDFHIKPSVRHRVGGYYLLVNSSEVISTQ